MERPASGSLADANWVENTVVDGVIEEQHLCRFNKDGNQRQQAVADQKINACGKYGENGGHKRADNVVAEDRQQHAEDADGEIVDQHFKTGGMCSSTRLSNCLMTQPASGPITIAPISMV